jgi:ABC-type sugar transport system ATPase subunit
MDEPTSSLTKAEITALFNMMRKLKKTGVSIVFISHHLDEIFEIADRVTILKDGEYITTMDIDALNESKLISLMVGRELNEIYPPKGNSRRDKVLDVKNLCQGEMLRDISFELYAGEIVGVAGLIGAGRTELAETLFGARKITQGNMFVRGEKIKKMSPKTALKGRIGFLTEDRKSTGLFLNMTVKENITITIIDKICKFGIINRKKEKQITAKYITTLKIKTPSNETTLTNLSGGNQQKVVLGKWLACDSSIIILDEPTRGIDVGAKMEIYNQMRTLANEGNAILMISSELTEIIGMSDRVLVMRNGRLAGEIGIQNMTEDNILAYAMGGKVR